MKSSSSKFTKEQLLSASWEAVLASSSELTGTTTAELQKENWESYDSMATKRGGHHSRFQKIMKKLYDEKKLERKKFRIMEGGTTKTVLFYRPAEKKP